jgi:hypothetical protein
MTMPGFTAEASLYKTNGCYQLIASGGFLSDGSTTVVPQGCGFFRWLACGAAVGACVPLCGINIPCYVGCLGISIYGFCRDCIRRALS